MNLYELKYTVHAEGEPGYSDCCITVEARTLLEACQNLEAQVPEAALTSVIQTHVGG